MTAMEEDVDDRFAGIDIDSLLNRVERKPYRAGRAKTLYEAPEFVQRLTGEETVLEGQSLCIQTKVRGFPAPTLRWFKDSEEILDHARIVVESDGKGGYCLYINNVNKGDEAAYRCRAENVEGACSCYFFLSVKSKPKNSKKKDTSNRRTVSFPPMFSTIVEKVEEEEKQGKELETLPPSPMTDFYYALTLKGRQTWPTFVGDWAFTKDGHPHKRRNSTGSITSDSYASSSEDVFSDEEEGTGYDEAPPAKKPHFFIDDDTTTSSESDLSPTTEGLVVYNSNTLSSLSDSGYTSADAQGQGQNERNNNDTVSEILDNRKDYTIGRPPEVDTAQPKKTGDFSNDQTQEQMENETSKPDLSNNNQAPGDFKGTDNTKEIPKLNIECTVSLEDDRGEESGVPRKRIKIEDTDTAGWTPQIGETRNPSTESNMQVRCVNIITPEPHIRGDITPPIIVELWEEAEPTAKAPRYSPSLDDTSPLSSATFDNQLALAGHAKEEGEPTSFLKNLSTAIDSKLCPSSASTAGKTDSAILHEGVKTEREGEPFYEDKPGQSPYSSQKGPQMSLRDASEEERREFRRSPTPFFDKTTQQLAAQGVDLHLPGPCGSDVVLPASGKSGGGTRSAQTSSTLLVPGTDRNQRESTPYYNEQDPYLFIHHPDHHFEEKKANLLKQRSLEENQLGKLRSSMPQLADTGRSSSDPSPAKRTTDRTKSSDQPQPPKSLTLRMPTSTSADSKLSTTSKSLTTQHANSEQNTSQQWRAGKGNLEAEVPKTAEIPINQSKSMDSPQSPVRTFCAAPPLGTLVEGSKVQTLQSQTPKSTPEHKVSKLPASTAIRPVQTKTNQTSAQGKSEIISVKSNLPSSLTQPSAVGGKPDQRAPPVKPEVNRENVSRSSLQTKAEPVSDKSTQEQQQTKLDTSKGRPGLGPKQTDITEKPEQTSPHTVSKDARGAIPRTRQRRTRTRGLTKQQRLDDKTAVALKAIEPLLEATPATQTKSETVTRSRAKARGVEGAETEAKPAVAPVTMPVVTSVPSGASTVNTTKVTKGQTTKPLVTSTAVSTSVTTAGSNLSKKPSEQLKSTVPSAVTAIQPTASVVTSSKQTAIETQSKTPPTATSTQTSPPVKSSAADNQSRMLSKDVKPTAVAIQRMAPLAMPETLTPEMPRSSKPIAKSRTADSKSAPHATQLPPTGKQERQAECVSIAATGSPAGAVQRTQAANRRQEGTAVRQMATAAANVVTITHPTPLASTVRMSPTPPAETALKKRDGKSPSRLSGALPSFLRPKQRGARDSSEEKLPVKDKSKGASSAKDKGKKRRKRSGSSEAANTAEPPAQARQLSTQDLVKCSPFGRYTIEGLCFLFVLTMICLHHDLHVEKLVCYVLASFYTFCVLRILGLVE